MQKKTDSNWFYYSCSAQSEATNALFGIDLNERMFVHYCVYCSNYMPFNGGCCISSVEHLSSRATNETKERQCKCAAPSKKSWTGFCLKSSAEHLPNIYRIRFSHEKHRCFEEKKIIIAKWIFRVKSLELTCSIGKDGVSTGKMTLTPISIKQNCQ